MRKRVLIRVGLYSLVGALVAVLTGLLGPRYGLALLAGLIVVGGLAAVDNLRDRQGWILGEMRREADKTRRLVKSVDYHRADDFHQIQALLNLHAMTQVRHALPPARTGWSATPDVLLLLVSLVQRHRPQVIVDLGSGVSTVWLAMALRDFGVEGRIVSIDHDPEYAELTREALVAGGLEKFAEVRVAPLVDTEVSGEVYPWYDGAALADIDHCDILFVDGPPGTLRDQARYPALPKLAAALGPDAVVVVDDYARGDETAMVSRWLIEYPGWQLRSLRFEKGAALLSRSSSRAR